MLAAYFRRHEEIFKEDQKLWINEEKVRLLLHNLALSEQEKYCDFISPHPRKKKLVKLVTKKHLNYYQKCSVIDLFSTQWKCLNRVKTEDENFVTDASTINRMCKRFKLKELTPDISASFMLKG